MRFAFYYVQLRRISNMLKITRLSQQGLMKLEGELLEPWVGTVRDACSKESRQDYRPRLDLAAVTYVDAAGAQILRDLINEGVEIAACSTFIGALLELEMPHGSSQSASPVLGGEGTDRSHRTHRTYLVPELPGREATSGTTS
jgi:ABC-type transporter Mla MlaB component